MTTALKNIINQSPLAQADKDELIAALERGDNRNDVIIRFQEKIKAVQDSIVDELGKIDDPDIKAIHAKLQADFAVIDHKETETLKRLKEDQADFEADITQYTQDLEKIVADSK